MELLSDNAAGQLPGGLSSAGPRLTVLRAGARRVIDAIHLTATAVAAAALIVELVIILWDVTQRQFLSRSFLWSDESAKLTLSTIAFIGGAAAYRSRQHTSVRVLLDLMPGPLCNFVLAALEWAVVVVSVIAGWQSLLLMDGNWQTLTPILQISTGWIALPLPIGMALVALFALERLGLQHRPGIAASALLLVVGGILRVANIRREL